MVRSTKVHVHLKLLFFQGFMVELAKVHVPILQFAKDILLFWKYDDAMCDILMKIAKVFEIFSRLKVIWHKSSLWY